MTQNRLPGKFSEIGGMYPAHLLISQDELTAMVQRLGKQITEDYCGKQILLVSILKGSFIFCSDLVRAIDLPTTVEFMAKARHNVLKNIFDTSYISATGQTTRAKN